MGNIHPYAPFNIASGASTPRGCGGRSAAAPTATGDDAQVRRLGKACADFEAIFVEQLFKTMRASVPEEGLMDGGRAEEIYTAMLDQQIAHDMAHGQGTLGLAHQMRGNLVLRGGKDAADETPEG